MDDETKNILLSLITDLKDLRGIISTLIEKSESYLEKTDGFKGDYNPDAYIEKEMMKNANLQKNG